MTLQTKYDEQASYGNRGDLMHTQDCQRRGQKTYTQIGHDAKLIVREKKRGTDNSAIIDTLKVCVRQDGASVAGSGT